MRPTFADGGDLRVGGNIGRRKHPIVLDGDDSAIEADGTAERALSLLDAPARRSNGLSHEGFDVAPRRVVHQKPS